MWNILGTLYNVFLIRTTTYIYTFACNYQLALTLKAYPLLLFT